MDLKLDPENRIIIPNSIAKETIRNVMKERGFTYKELSNSLRYRGIECGELSLKNKINRGTFSATFFFDCMISMEVKNIEWED